MREGSAPNFCPPVEEGLVVVFQDEETDEEIAAEFLGVLLHRDRRYGFFFPISEDTPAGSSGDIFVLEVVEVDEDDQPAAFEPVQDEAIAAEVYADFCAATKDLYDFV